MILLLAFSIILGYVMYKFLVDYFSPMQEIPEPPRYFLLGHMPYFKKGADSLKVISKWGEEFKKYGMYKLDTLVGLKWKVVLLEPEMVKTVLTKTDTFTRADIKYFPLLGKALLTSVGEEHRHQKKLLNKAFTMSQMKYYVPVFNKHTLVLTELWEELVKDQPEGVNTVVKDYFTNMTFDALGEICFGYSFNSQRTQLNPFGKALSDQLTGVLTMRGRMILEYLPFMWYMPFGPGNTLTQSSRVCSKVLEEVLENRVKLMQEGNLTETQENDLLALMIKEKDEKFTEQTIKDNAFTFLFAGHETTATGLPGILMYLAKNPEMQERARQEINDLITDFENLSMDQLNQLVYTDAFIKESLRLFIPASQMFRITTKRCKLGNYTIPKRTGVVMPSYLIHEIGGFEKGKEFIPERWLSDDLKRGPYLTFGYGPYSCIGKHFALVEMKVAIVQLLKKFKFTMDPGSDEFIRRVAVTLQLYPNIKIRIHKL